MEYEFLTFSSHVIFKVFTFHVESVVNVHLQLLLCWQHDGATHNGRTLPCCFATVCISWSGQ